MENAKLLEKAGLTKNESVIYLTLLRSGVMTSGEILKKSGVNSGKIYDILERLKTKGLLSETTVNNVRHFAAAQPSQILKYMKKIRDDIERDEKEIKSILPNLEKMAKIQEQHINVKVYTGYRGIETAMDELLSKMNPGDEILGMGSTKFNYEKTKRFWKRYIKIRIKKKIQTKTIFSERTGYYKEYKKMKYSQSRILEIITPVTVYVYGHDNVLILNYEDPPSCIVIHDSRTADSFRNFFKQLWTISKE